MEYADYIQSIRFRFLQPDRKRPTGFRALSLLLSKLGIHLEMLNTILPDGDDTMMRDRLRRACCVPRMSTFAIGAIINEGVRRMPTDQVFVNVGVWNGFTFLCGMAGNDERTCIGVDSYPFDDSPRPAFQNRFVRVRSPNHHFHHMDFKDYFADVHTEPIGFYIFDGPHRYEDQYDGLKVAEPFLADGCIVLVDDTNWDRVRRGTLDFIAKSEHNYRTLLDVTTPKSGHPTYWNGIMVFQKTGPPAGMQVGNDK